MTNDKIIHEINGIRFLLKNGIGTYIESHDIYDLVEDLDGNSMTVKTAIEN